MPLEPTRYKEFAENLFSDVHTRWIEPELNRRFGKNVPSNFKIHRCLIRLPAGRDPIVEFNEEFSFIAVTKVADGGSLTPGNDVYLHEIEEIKSVEPISLDGKRVPFILLLSQDGLWTIIFDADPGEEPVNSTAPWQFSDHIRQYLENRMAARAVTIPAAAVQRLRDFGLWPAPSLLPYPLSRINKHLEDGETSAASALLVRHCTSDFLRQLVSKWKSVDEFCQRERLFLEALDAHSRGQYSLSIYSLLPQLEGVMSDWLHRRSGAPLIKHRQESKTEQFFDLIAAKAKLTSTGTSVVNGTIDFVLKGPVLQTFKKWDDVISDAFPGRHLVSHGKYDQNLLSEGNSVKVFLLLDTVYEMLKL